MNDLRCDVVVVGAGNAALCAALAARESGADVLVLESAPFEDRGGNSRFTGGMIRLVYNGVDDLLKIIPDLAPDEIQNTDFGAYTAENFYEDMERTTQYRADADLVKVMVEGSLDAMIWLYSHGVRFVPAYGHQAYKVNGRFKFWGGLTVQSSGGGPGLITALNNAAERAGITIMYETRATSLIEESGRILGVEARKRGEKLAIRAGAVVLASGGFEANSEWRTRYLGPGWDLAKVRGTRFNQGDGIRMALDAGAMPHGNWSGAHAVAWDRNAPDFGDLEVGDAFQKHSYPLGIMINADGNRFVDEGADFRNYTYAKYGQEVLRQPRQFAWQVFDSKVINILRDEYRIRQATRVRTNTLEEMAARLDDVDGAQFLRTVAEFNAAVDTETSFNPAILDGRGTRGLDVPKSNWANPLDTPPYEAYQITCGVTFTFGGLRINTAGQVLDLYDAPMPGLYAAGELVGGLFYFNYPGGTGLTSGAVFGRVAGTSAVGALRQCSTSAR
ncbi:MAG TPA: FAD-dependent tricarballylate dehydrogenase TcuA [Thermomicrobiales bacterium]|nr:FAD-dependent tricarballylate dehydrogenase TcuA [Thermomicrobiales bacterium]